MKKIFSFLLMSAMLLAMGASVASCSSSSDDEGGENNPPEEEYVATYRCFTRDRTRLSSHRLHPRNP